MLLARGDHRANYTDLAEGKYDSVSQSVVMNIQGEFDQMIHNVVTKINDILADAAGVQSGDLELADGTKLTNVKYCAVESDGYMRMDDGKGRKTAHRQDSQAVEVCHGEVLEAKLRGFEAEGEKSQPQVGGVHP